MLQRGPFYPLDAVREERLVQKTNLSAGQKRQGGDRDGSPALAGDPSLSSTIYQSAGYAAYTKISVSTCPTKLRV